MVVPAWLVYLLLAVICAASGAFPAVGAAVACMTAFMLTVRLLVIGIHPLKDEIEFL